MNGINFDFKDILKPISDISTDLIKLIPNKNKAAEIAKELELAAREIEAKGMELEKTMQAEITKRAASDMVSDSWLSKNIRPLSLICISGMFVIMTILSYFGGNPSEKITEVVEYLLYMIFGFYFGGRSIEKSVKMISEKIGKK